MKIGLVLPSVPSYSETFFRSKIKGLLENGFEVILFVVNTEDKNTINCRVIGLPNYYLNNKIAVFFKSFFEVILNLRTSKKLYYLCRIEKLSVKKSIRNVFMNSCFLNQKLDWLHFGFGTLSIGRECVADAIDSKMAVSFRGFDIGVFPIKNKNCYKIVWNKVDKIHVISDDIAALVLENGLENEDKITKITPAINIDFFSRKPASKNQYPLTEITTVGRLHWKKGFEYTLEALSILKNKGYDFQYTIIGDGPEKERLEFAVHQLGLTNNVKFLGKLSPDEVKNQLQNADIYIQYSIQEGFCNAVLEAQAMGKTCIVSDAEGLTENVLDNKTGFVVEKRNSLSLANKIIEVILLDEKTKKILQKNAAERIQTEFNIEKQIRQFINFYTQ